MKIETIRLEYRTDDGVSLADITADVNRFVASSGIRSGLCILTLDAEGCSLTVSPDLDSDVDDLLRLARTHLEAPGPPGPEAARDADRLDIDDSGYIPGGVLAASLTLPVRDGALGIGNWDAIVLLDGRGPVLRPVEVTLVGA